MNTRFLVGGFLTIILLFLYAYLVYEGLSFVLCEQKCIPFNSQKSAALVLLSGLVSGVVIAELALTPPNKLPAARLLSQNATPRSQRWVGGVAIFYLLVWTIAGLACFFVAYLSHPDKLATLSDLGWNWIGLAVTAAYAWIGVDRTP